MLSQVGGEFGGGQGTNGVNTFAVTNTSGLWDGIKLLPKPTRQIFSLSKQH